MSVAHVDDDDDEKDEIHKPGEVYNVEKIFPNGEIYIGQWADNCPNGKGKCLWADGCMYVGDWYKGKSMGKGKFSWPCGATYEGQFKNGYVDGEGVYIGSSNSSYKGTWMSNMRHGRGIQSYVNGDCYEGQWKLGQPDGEGRYHWKNGNQYIGYWWNGKMSGCGIMIWANGNQYEGSWEAGLPRGNGTFRWVDGRFYVGVWSEDRNKQSGAYYPSNGEMLGSFDWDPQDVYSVKPSDFCISVGEKIQVFPSMKMVNWPCEGSYKEFGDGAVRLRRACVIGRPRNGYSFDLESDLTFEGSNGSLGSGKEVDEVGRRSHLIIKPAKMQGHMISKGHKNYELMLNLQLGIRHSVGRCAPATSIDLKATAFDHPRSKTWTRFPPEGSKHTPPHQSCEFKWKDYFPVVFRTLRKLFKVDPADYMISICGNDALRELSSPGKSGSFFYLTNNDKYMIKTMKKSEVKVLKRMLPAYYNHVQSYDNTLVTKFFGLHCVKMTGSAHKKVRFVIMGNLFCTEYAIHRRFDLKGSSHGRLTVNPESEIESTTTLKDLDLNFIFRLHKSWFQEFCRQVNRDCDFLEQERIMDYSLLVGIHFREISHSPSTETNVVKVRRSNDLDLHIDNNWSASNGLVSSSQMRARAEVTVRRNNGTESQSQPQPQAQAQVVGEVTGEYYDVILVFGIIDILQDYDISKKLEHAYKSFQYDPTSISAVDPRQYSKRFRDFIFRIFTQDN